jgi:threonyl-tRNA synthetase
MGAKKTGRELLAEKGLLKDVVAISVAGKVIDLHTPIDVDAAYELVTTQDPRGLAVIRHSSAHVMADAVQRLFPGTKVTIGPSIDDGFYYDFKKPEGTFSEDDLAKIEKAMVEIIGKKSPFKRIPVSRDEALAKFRDMGETFKVEIIESIPAGEEISLYFHGEEGKQWVDVCEGPHVPNTGFLKAVKLTSVAGAYWRGDEKNPMLQRIYGTAFPSKEALEEHLRLNEEAKQRDHRKLGKELELFFFDPIAPAMPFFLPKGAFVYNALVGYVRGLYEDEGYEEVITPQAFDPKLFRTSGHLGNYNENMYRLWTEDQVDEISAAQVPDATATTVVAPKIVSPASESWGDALREAAFALKPMNCPSHCVIFGMRKRSYRELPWRVADFGRLHRYERGGVVHGLSRVRTFCQDDAHIFCTRKQVPAEIEKFIRFLNVVYKSFGFERIDIKLATRPEKRIGSEADWDEAEGALELGLKNAGLPFEITPGEGAFYGPKVEFHIHDALKRSWQLGTIQYDPNLPERFELGYIGEDGKEHRPVMLHRAILGSLERFFSVYLEHSSGNFPAWIAPKQAIVVTVSEKADDYATDVAKRLREKGFRIDTDTSADKLGAKIRNARLSRIPYMVVVGVKEAETGTVGVRSRDKGELGAMPLDTFVELLSAEAKPPRG